MERRSRSLGSQIIISQALELPALLDWARQGKLELSAAITRTIPLEPDAINDALDRLETFGDDLRVVIKT